jgi:AraC-like DNA-binding protein
MTDRKPPESEDEENPVLPDSYLWFRTQNLDEARETITQAYDPHTLESLDSLKDADISLHHASFNSVSLSIIHYGNDVTATVEKLSGIYVFMPLHGELELSADGEKVVCKPGSGVVVNAGANLVKTMRGGYRQLVVKLDPDIILRYLSSLNRFVAEEPIVFETRMEQEGRTKSWWRTVRYVMDEMSSIDPSCPQQMMSEVLGQLLVQSLVCSQPHNYSEALYSPRERQLAPWYVKKAEEYIEAHASHSLTLADVAEATQVSERSLQNAFKKARGMSPMQYLREVRLDMANRALLTAAPEESVTPVAISCGFKQLSRFAKQYKERYGELPSETLHRTMLTKPSQATP